MIDARIRHFIQCDSPNLEKMTQSSYNASKRYDIILGADIAPMTKLAARRAAAIAQAKFLDDVVPGYSLNILIGSNKQIVYGEVEVINHIHVWLKGHKQKFNLSEVTTVTIPA